MTAHELLTELRTKGVEIKASSEDRLVIDAPKGTITEELRAALSGSKADLLTILKAEGVQKGAKASVSQPAVQNVRAPNDLALWEWNRSQLPPTLFRPTSP